MDTTTLHGFADELTKIAAKKSKKQQEEPRSMGQKALAGVGGAAASVGTNLGFMAATAPNMYTPAGQIGTEGVGMGSLDGAPTQDQLHFKRKIQGMGQQMGVSPDTKVTTPMGGKRMRDVLLDPNKAAWMTRTESGRDHVNVPLGAHESIAAHELGHVKNYQGIDRLGKKVGLKRLGNTAMKVRGVSTALASRGAMPAAAAAAMQDDPTWTPGLLAAGASAPMLLDEGMASLHGARQMVRQYGMKQGLRRAAPLATAFGTYASMAGVPLAITAGRKLLKRRREAAQNTP